MNLKISLLKFVSFVWDWVKDSTIFFDPDDKILVLRDNLKPLLCFDLDETLIRTHWKDAVNTQIWQSLNLMLAFQESQIKKGAIKHENRELFRIIIHNGSSKIAIVQLRPYLREFFIQAKQKYNLSYWSAGQQVYVNTILKIFSNISNSDNCYLFAWSWDQCHEEDVKDHVLGPLVYTKPIEFIFHKVVDATNQNTLLVDNRKDNGCHNPQNLVHVPDFLPEPWVDFTVKDNFKQYSISNDVYLQSAIFEDIEKQLHLIKNTTDPTFAQRDVL